MNKNIVWKGKYEVCCYNKNFEKNNFGIHWECSLHKHPVYGNKPMVAIKSCDGPYKQKGEIM